MGNTAGNVLQAKSLTTFEVVMVDESGVVMDISSATTLEIRFKMPSGTTLVKSASLVTTGTDGKLEYTAIVSDLVQLGPWKIQGYVVLDTWAGFSSIGYFEVEENL